MTKAIETENAPKAIGPYSQAVTDGNYIFVSGQLPIDLKTGKLIEDDIRLQTHCVLDYIEAILKASGSSLEFVLRVEIFLANMQDFTAVNEEYAKRFIHPIKPARQTIQAILPKNASIEISCIAKIGNSLT